ncbi:hypothetical protein WN943_019686 [Citrus x changshan-huyou]
MATVSKFTSRLMILTILSLLVLNYQVGASDDNITETREVAKQKNCKLWYMPIPFCKNEEKNTTTTTKTKLSLGFANSMRGAGALDFKKMRSEYENEKP